MERLLSTGIIETTIDTLAVPPNDTLVWLDPAINPKAFIVGEEVLQTFIDNDPTAISTFQPLGNKQWRTSLYKLAQKRLYKLGITTIYRGNFCIFSDKRRFFSYRRDQITGRMLSIIWINSS